MPTITSASRADHGGWTRQLGAAVTGIILALLATTATAVYVIPLIESGALRVLVLIGAPVVTTLAVGVPLQRLILKSPYIDTLMAFGGGLFACAVCVVVVSAVFDSMRGGQFEFARVRNRTNAIERVISH